MVIKKRLWTFILAGTMIFSMGINVFAKSNTDVPVSPTIQRFASDNNITNDEAVNLSKNVRNALKKASKTGQNTLEGNETKEIPVSENLVLEISLDVEEPSSMARATVYERTVTSTYKLKNIYGGTVITLKSVGIFNTNGTTSKPVDAYGTYDAIVWNVTNSNPTLGSPAYNAWVRNSFSGELNVGIDPVSMTVQSFSTSCKIYCNAIGTYSASWS